MYNTTYEIADNLYDICLEDYKNVAYEVLSAIHPDQKITAEDINLEAKHMMKEVLEDKGFVSAEIAEITNRVWGDKLNYKAIAYFSSLYTSYGSAEELQEQIKKEINMDISLQDAELVCSASWDLDIDTDLDY